MPRILRAQNKLSPATVRFGQKIATSKNAFRMAGQTIVKSRVAVRRVMANDPVTQYNDPLARDTVNQFTNSVNPNFHPEKSPGAVSVKRVPQRPQGTTKGHGGSVKNVTNPNLGLGMKVKKR